MKNFQMIIVEKNEHQTDQTNQTEIQSTKDVVEEQSTGK